MLRVLQSSPGDTEEVDGQGPAISWWIWAGPRWHEHCPLPHWCSRGILLTLWLLLLTYSTSLNNPHCHFFWSRRHLVSKLFPFFVFVLLILLFRVLNFHSLAHVGIPKGAGVIQEKGGLCQCQWGGRPSRHPTGPGQDEHHVGESLNQISSEKEASGWSSKGLLYFKRMHQVK